MIFNLQFSGVTESQTYRSLFEIGLNILNVLSYRYMDAILNSFKMHSQTLVLITNMSDLNKPNENSNQGKNIYLFTLTDYHLLPGKSTDKRLNVCVTHLEINFMTFFFKMLISKQLSFEPKDSPANKR